MSESRALQCDVFTKSLDTFEEQSSLFERVVLLRESPVLMNAGNGWDGLQMAT